MRPAELDRITIDAHVDNEIRKGRFVGCHAGQICLIDVLLPRHSYRVQRAGIGDDHIGLNANAAIGLHGNGPASSDLDASDGVAVPDLTPSLNDRVGDGAAHGLAPALGVPGATRVIAEDDEGKQPCRNPRGGKAQIAPKRGYDGFQLRVGEIAVEE